jgi:hypothetical protein
MGAFRLGDKPLAHNLKQKQGSPTLYPVDQVELARFADRDRRTCADLLAQLVPNAQRSLGMATLQGLPKKVFHHFLLNMTSKRGNLYWQKEDGCT